MKIRLGLMISMLGASMLASAAMAQTQQATTEPSRATQATTAKPSTAQTQPVPSVGTVPGVPGVPAVPNVPSVPSVPNGDPLADVVFPPDLIMRHARELELSGEQKAFMRAEIQRTTTRFNELQWQLMDSMEALHEAMKASSVNEQLALSQLDKVLDIEREVKRLHISLGVRLKNQLTPEQQAKLQGLRGATSFQGQPTPRPND